MAKDFIGYEALAENALRGVVREALRDAEKRGLIGAHHFYVTFRTGAPGVEIPDFLTERFPDEMTIVIQHQFWDFKVDDDRFQITLTFQKIPATLVVPFAALTAFVDPGVQFGLQFKGSKAAPGQAGKSVPTAPAPKSADAPAEPAEPNQVVSLDQFRKK